ncbi:hypothetical protein B0A55_01667 [Friedmanniomyces simplex]|uniref:BTB domain-containing protein n=1 Tax=Friedmanniomyces simplex TaxID=329884 RepID=A0A4U0XT16_9PEZI|nr:hypothetical protein B0A55_01667 [Friedmanniomyces simplex]
MMDFQEFFGSKTYADITLRFGGQELPAHRLILTKGSDYFKAMLDSKFEVHDIPNALNGLISTFYGHAPYDKQAVNCTDEGLLQITHSVDLYVTASKYLVPTMCAQIANDFAGMLEAVKGGTGYSANVETVARHVYFIHAGAADELRAAIVNVIAADIDAWRAAEEFAQLIADLPDLAMDIISALAGAKSQPAVGQGA